MKIDLKSTNKKWSGRDNNIYFNDLIENLKPSVSISKSDDNKPVIYVPVHNINDIYEWYRIFKDNHLYGINNDFNSNFDRFGFAIHGYFDKESAQSIRTYFPNLYLVKAASSETFEYSGSIRKSIDYIDNIAAEFDFLTIDGETIHDGESILLKNQYIETASTYVIDTTISTSTSLVFAYTIGDEDKIKKGSVLRVIFTDSTEQELDILDTRLESGNFKIIINSDIDISLISYVYDKNNAVWTKTSYETENGLYKYENKYLVRYTEMNSFDTVYNQIVYCYQGSTQKNDEYYLRRIEDNLDSNYSKFPEDSFNVPFYYSKGEAYLIKFEFDYDLSLNDPELPLSPLITNSNWTEDCFRLLYLDHDSANKILAKDQYGIGIYDSLTDVNLGIGFMANTIYNILHIFDGNTEGARARNTLLKQTEFGNTVLYGTTRIEGTNNTGTIFRYNIDLNTITILHQFSSTLTPNSKLWKYGDKLYGCALGGDPAPPFDGVIYSYDIVTNTFAIEHQFDTGIDNGSGPYQIYLDSNTGTLYGGTAAASPNAILYKYHIPSSTYTKLHQFSVGDKENYCELCQIGDILYGITNAGVIYTYDVVLDVYTAINAPNTTYRSFSGFFEYSGMLYGVISIDNKLISMHPTLFTLSTLYSYIVSTNSGTPSRSTLCVYNNKFYGTTINGGALTYGVMYEFDPGTSTYTKIMDFGYDGKPSSSTSTLVEHNSELYSTLETGDGIYGDGLIYKVLYNPGNQNNTLNDLTFNKYDANLKYNVLQEYCDREFYASPISPNFKFRHKELAPNETYDLNMIFDSSYSYKMQLTTNTLSVTYHSSVLYKIPVGAFKKGDFIKFTVDFLPSGTDQYNALEQIFVVTNITTDTTNSLVLNFFPYLDTNFVNEYNAFYTAPNLIDFTIGCINQYGDYIINYITPEYNLSLLENAINKTIIKDTYMLEYHTDNSNYSYIDIFNTKQTHRDKWANHGIDLYVSTLDTHNYFRHKYDINDKLIYYKEYYDINEYLTNYLLLSDYKIAQLQDNTIDYYNIVADDRFGLEYNKIILGKDYRQYAYENLKSGTFINIIPSVASETNNVYIQSIADIENETILTTTTIFSNIPGTNEPVTIEPVKEISKISTLLKNEFYRVVAASTANVNTASPGATLDGITLTNGDLILLKNQSTSSQNGVWKFNGAASALTQQNIDDKFVLVLNGTTNSYKTYQSSYVAPLTIGATSVTYNEILDKYKKNVVSASKDTSSYAHALMNYLKDLSNNNNSDLLNNISTIIYSENGEPRVSFIKRENTFDFGKLNIPEDYTIVQGVFTTDIDVLNPPSTIGTHTIKEGDLILLTANVTISENGVYTYNGQNFNPILTRLSGPYSIYDYYFPYNDAMTEFYAWYSDNLGEVWTSVNNTSSLKYDTRLYLKPIAIAKLGVDNETQPWRKISYKYDVLESEENLITIQSNINGRRRIRFVDGLTEYNILNNVNGQGQYDWILDDNVDVLDAVVGCTQDNGPGTGTLIWYTGTWNDGIWVDGIWINGTWMNGTWMNGTWNSYVINDFWYYVEYIEVQTPLSSRWYNGTWMNGTHNGGTWYNGTWTDGTWNGGYFTNGIWLYGIWNNGYFSNGTWTDGIWNNGYFESGEWIYGTFDKIDSSLDSIFGYNSTISNRAIWRNGTFKDGEVWSGKVSIGSGNFTAAVDDHRRTIMFACKFEFGIFKSGTIVQCAWHDGIFENGVWLGGYYATLTANTTSAIKEFTIDTDQYYNILGENNFDHNIHNIGQTSVYLFGYLTSANITAQGSNASFWKSLFYDMNEDYNTSTYSPKTISTLYNNNSTLLYLGTASGDCLSPTPAFIVDDPLTGDMNGSPFIASVWLNGTWKDGIWCNGIAKNGTFEKGMFIRGYIEQASTFGVNQE